MLIADCRDVRALHSTERRQLCVSVLFTDVSGTLRALSKAGSLAAGLNATIEVIAPIVVPYPLPVDQPPVSQSHIRRVHTIVGGTTVPTRINVIYCRDRSEAVRSLLKADTVLVMAWKRRFLFDKTLRLANELRHDGFHVITVEETRGA